MGQRNEDIKINADTVLFFDMDGTLIDTNLANFLSYKKAINSVTKMDNDLTFNSNKRFNRSILKNSVPNLSEAEYERIVQEKEEYYNDFLHETICKSSAKSGLSTTKNMVRVCSKCNIKKKDLTLNQFIKKYNLNRNLIESNLEALNKIY